FAAQGLGEDRYAILNALPSRALVKQVLGLADIYLDSFPYTGANSTVDPLEVGVPAVVIEGRQMRCRQGPALLRELGTPELVAADVNGYIELASRLGNDADFRRQMRERVTAGMQNKPRFMDSAWYSQRIGECLSEVMGQSGY